MSSEWATADERLLAAARADNEDLLLEVFEEKGFDINCKDGSRSSRIDDVLEHILSHEECDVDPQNRTDNATPLHLAVQIEHADLRKHIVESLLDAGADTRLKDKNGFTVLDIVSADDTEVRAMIRKAQATNSVSLADIEIADDDGEPGSGSGSESE
ncbi:hypothetical protein BKA70DRAFT_1370862 [Coprinopsis sp. MPI-PUGE-AT-0042]|nr:hypothetical protein BKA70DRAFT_1370862 [Coprinopsis sp. MPI-PUGE-AT-0042]